MLSPTGIKASSESVGKHFVGSLDLFRRIHGNGRAYFRIRELAGEGVIVGVHQVTRGHDLGESGEIDQVIKFQGSFFHSKVVVKIKLTILTRR